MLDPITRHLLNGAGSHGPIILMYHAIERDEGKASWPWSLSLERFIDQVKFLQDEGWNIVRMMDLDASQPETRPARTIVITFDDGFANNLDAAEALIHRGIPASWFIVSGAIGKLPYWSDSGRPDGRMLDAGELRMLHSHGMEIGAHSANHVRLPELSDETIQDELATSKAALEDILGSEVSSFAYPYGAWDTRCERYVVDAGFRRACTTVTGWALKDRNPFRMRRLSILNHDNHATLARKLALASNDGSWKAVIRYGRARLARMAGVR